MDWSESCEFLWLTTTDHSVWESSRNLTMSAGLYMLKWFFFDILSGWCKHFISLWPNYCFSDAVREEKKNKNMSPQTSYLCVVTKPPEVGDSAWLAGQHHCCDVHLLVSDNHKGSKKLDMLYCTCKKTQRKQLISFKGVYRVNAEGEFLIQTQNAQSQITDPKHSGLWRLFQETKHFKSQHFDLTGSFFYFSFPA